ncbi:MAG TPA: hypothetical protein VK919_15790 [Solirubrobacterales bacterium]|nr:hypothetical protein [Solirubrobacterales bacterium]
MRDWIRERLTYANVIATLAVLAVVGGGTAWALQANSVRSRHIKDNAVKFRDLQGVKAWNKRVPVTGSDPDAGTARAEAKPVVLARRGPITIYGKCFRAENIDSVNAITFARTRVNGAVYRHDGGAIRRLNRTTPEQDRNIPGNASALSDQLRFWDPAFDRTTILTANHKLALNVVSHPTAKNGTPAIGNAPLGSGDRCSFAGFVIG